MENNDISFSKNEKEIKIGRKRIGISSNIERFNFRVASIIEKDGNVLLHKQKKDKFWNLLGGRVKYGETCEEALRRELSEELGCCCGKTQLVHVCENFFEFKGTAFHELLVIFRTELSDEIDMKEVEENIEIKWFPKNMLNEVVIKPEFVKKMMKETSNQISWLVNDEIRKE